MFNVSKVHYRNCMIQGRSQNQPLLHCFLSINFVVVTFNLSYVKHFLFLLFFVASGIAPLRSHQGRSFRLAQG